ncbi:PucR family transcriptional regulator [Nocardia bovistercoris]|uniref:Helix-turn-helix domain-containing protein n=1 Tax=Nocardia bovistercoris TaxID=2785916 RepID=A0A931IGU7_9NOCA|nr:helix-turn-helix domain-containing protein [Nocardia bovistercoris]MBH0781299.1 helix-turn-helix domain-containing protein [Nocardia bovistercoris]
MAVAPERVGPESDEVRDWLTDYAYETMRAETLDRVVARIDGAIVARVPELADRDMRRDLAASTRSQGRAMLGVLTSDTFEFVLPEDAHTLARTIARRGYELRVLLRTYHAGMDAVLEYMTDAVDERRPPPELERAIMLRLFDRATKWVSMSVERLTDTYMAERERVLRAALNRRTETVHAILAGDDLDIEQASTRLGYRLSQHHLACVLWANEPGQDGEMLGLLERTATRLAGALGSARVLTLPSGSGGMWVWIGFDDAVLAADLTAAAAVQRLAFGAVEAPVRVAFGVPAAQVAGFRDSHREAMAARQVAERGPARESRVTAYRAVEIAYLAGSDEAAMRGLVTRELRALAGRDANAARLRETLHAYLSAHRSPEGAAKMLGVHKNTVRYRIQRIEELLGHSIEQRGLPLEIALACVDAYGLDALP